MDHRTRQIESNERPGGFIGTIVGVIVVVAVLYFAKDILIPLAFAAVLAIVFSSLAGALEKTRRQVFEFSSGRDIHYGWYWSIGLLSCRPTD